MNETTPEALSAQWQAIQRGLKSHEITPGHYWLKEESSDWRVVEVDEHLDAYFPGVETSWGVSGIGESSVWVRIDPPQTIEEERLFAEAAQWRAIQAELKKPRVYAKKENLVQTCCACPSQWECGDLYIRYRHGCLTVDFCGEQILSMEPDDGSDGVMDTETMIRLTSGVINWRSSTEGATDEN